MNDANSPESPLESAAGAAGPRAVEAFSVLSDEMRLSILLALWESFEPWAELNTVPFSKLRERLGRPDSGRFNYHLDKLEGHFVRKTDDGYELRRAGLELVQTVIAGAGIEDRSLDPTEIDQDCYLCGGPTTVSYDDEMLFWVCTECDGLFSQTTDAEGMLAGWEFDPAGFTDRRPAELLNAATSGGVMQTALGGVCDACSGPMEGWLHPCDDHAADGLCPTCGWRDAAVARFRCAVCKRHHQMVPWYLVLEHPAVVAFYYERGVALQYEAGVRFQPRLEFNLRGQHDQELVSANPPRVRVTIQYDGDELQLTMDENLDVLEVTESGCATAGSER